MMATKQVAKEQISEILNKYKTDQEIYHELMDFRVREILLVATLYDAFILEQEDKLSEKIFGEYYQLNLSTAPRVTSVSFGEQALQILSKREFDMVILTMRIDEMSPFELSSQIRALNPQVPILLLLNDDTEVGLIRDRSDRLKHIDRVFIWNGDSKIFLAIIKYIEDRKNVDKDTRIGEVRVILLVEDSIRYYSRYLPGLYTVIMRQTQRLIADEHLDEMKKLLRMRARPKLLMAGTYEEAIRLFERYSDYMLCVISDARFPKEGRLDEEAGLKLIRYIRSQNQSLPALLQSSDPQNEAQAKKLDAVYVHKNSENLARDLDDFVYNYLGFGDFIFRNQHGGKIARARSIEEFKAMLRTVPDSSLVYHADRNHFSSWLMARGEIQIAKRLRPVQVSDFATFEGLRQHLIDICDRVHRNRTRGKVVAFDESVLGEASFVLRMGEGSLGGKGRGMAFLHTLIDSLELATGLKNVHVRIPRTAIIGTEEYDYFLEHGGLLDLLHEEQDYTRVRARALAGQLSSLLRGRLQRFLQHVREPLCVRSSGLFEDSISQPFSGIYETYLLPNNHPDEAVRLKQLEQAVKLVYASVFSPTARGYFEAIHYKIGEEKMAVLLQTVVGNRFGDRFYPHLSGVAQSYNYYPVSYLKPQDGIAVIGLGLGKYVIDGERAYRFCPKYPRLEFMAPEELLETTQSSFYALDMRENLFDLARGEEATLLRLPVSDAEEDGTLESCTSVWDAQNNRLQPGRGYRGTRVVNFASILKYNTFPLAETLEIVLEIVKSAMGTPVEIEFAVDLQPRGSGPPPFHLLQIKPLLGDMEDYSLDLSAVRREELFLYTERAMGNGRIGDLGDVVYLAPERFDRSRTAAMATELEGLNGQLRREGRGYILIGPGRWGSRDPWLGIPVSWPGISGARIIVEVELPEFKVDPSLGSHFFHNITSMNIGYFDVPWGAERDFIDWEWLKAQPAVQRTEHFVHARPGRPLVAKMDGRRSVSAIFKG
jgi:CheY-like chemotaxis protein